MTGSLDKSFEVLQESLELKDHLTRAKATTKFEAYLQVLKRNASLVRELFTLLKRLQWMAQDTIGHVFGAPMEVVCQNFHS